MASFEERIAARIATLQVLVVVLAVAVVAVAVVGSLGLVNASSAASTATAISREATMIGRRQVDLARRQTAVQEAQTRADAQVTVHNCAVITGLSQIESDFIRSDARDRRGDLTASERQQTIADFQKIIAKPFLQELIRKQQQLDRRTISYWTHALAPEAQHLVASADCPNQ